MNKIKQNKENEKDVGKNKSNVLITRWTGRTIGIAGCKVICFAS